MNGDSVNEKGQNMLQEKTGRGRDEAAEATARPQECVDHTEAALSGWRTKGAQAKGDPPSLETTALSSQPAWHGAFPTPTLAAAPSPLSPLSAGQEVQPSQCGGQGEVGVNTESRRCVCVCVCARACRYRCCVGVRLQ